MWSFWLLTVVLLVVVAVKGVVAYRADRQHQLEQAIAEARLKQATETVDRRRVTITNGLSRATATAAASQQPSTVSRAGPKGA